MIVEGAKEFSPVYSWGARPTSRNVSQSIARDASRDTWYNATPVQLTASDVMTGPPITVDQNTSLEDVMKSLEDIRIVRVPVTNDNTLIGIISRRDIIKAVLEPEFLTFGGL